MTYRLEQIFTKNGDQDWSRVIVGNVERSMNSTPDPRDEEGRSLYTENERFSRYSWFHEFSKQVGSNYVGWDREYIGNDKLVMIYYLATLDTARILHAACVEHRKDSDYKISYRVIDDKGNEISL